MAEMIPSSPHPSATQSERRVFNALAGCPDDWTIFHGVARSEKTKGRRRVPGGECDFIVCIPNVGWVVVEVKGQGVRFLDNRWVREYRGRRDSLNETPVMQARQNAHDMRDYLRGIANDLGRCPFFWAVAFPFEYVASPENNTGNTLSPVDCADANNIKNAIDRIVSQTRERLGLPDPRGGLPLQDVVEAFRTKVEVAADMVMLQSEQTFFHLSNEQSDALAGAALIDEVLVEGPAGSGKTLLAMHIAREAARYGLRTLVFTDTVGLREWMQQETFGTPSLTVHIDAMWVNQTIQEVLGSPPLDVAIATIDRQVTELQRQREELVRIQQGEGQRRGGGPVKRNDPDYVKKTLQDIDNSQSQMLSEAFSRMTESGFHVPWDLLVWDEFQHFPYPETARVVIDHFQKVKVFADFSRQDVLGHAVGIELQSSILNQMAGRSVRLKRNMRNSANVAQAVHDLTGLDTGEPNADEGLQVEVHYIDNDAFIEPSLAGETIRVAIEQRVEALPHALADVSRRVAAILGPQDLTEEPFRWESMIGEYPIRRMDGEYLRDAEPLESHICISSIREFSGLESPVVFYVEGPNKNDGPTDQEIESYVKYAALTRARSLLCILTPESNRDYYEERLPDALHIPPDEPQVATRQL